MSTVVMAVLAEQDVQRLGRYLGGEDLGSGRASLRSVCRVLVASTLADHVFLHGCEVNLGGGQLGMAQDPLHVGGGMAGSRAIR